MSKKGLIILYGDKSEQVEGIKDYATVDIFTLTPDQYHADIFNIKNYYTVTVMIHGNYSMEHLKVLITHCFENDIPFVNVNNEVKFRSDSVDNSPNIGINSEWFWNNKDTDTQKLHTCLGYTNDLFSMMNSTDYKNKHEMVKAIIEHRDKYFKGDNNE